MGAERNTNIHRSLLCLMMLLVLSGPAAAQAQDGSVGALPSDYLVGPQDVLLITVFDQPDLTRKYTVEADGSFTFPLIERVSVASLTLRQVEALIRAKLADGYLRNPSVSVVLDSGRSQRYIVLGAVRTPASYTLTGDTTLLDAIASAGGAVESAGSDVQIIRPRRAEGTAKPDPEVLIVDLEALQAGRATNLQLRGGDQVTVKFAEIFYVSGQVRNPKSYPLKKGMTILQALSLAGGITDRGSSNRIVIRRLVDGQLREIRATEQDLVQPNETIFVRERFL